MSAENMTRDDQAAALNDSELEDVAGGDSKFHCSTNDKYYRYLSHEDISYGKSAPGAYLCPNCRRIVHKGSWGRYYCDPCNASWYHINRLVPNMESGLWREISKDEYNDFD